MSRPATSRLKVNAPLGLRPSLENRRVEELQIDATYQRSLDTAPSQALIRKLAMFWDWGLYQPLVVARRPDGSLWVVDGQHRHAAARMRGDIGDLPCVVTPYAHAGDEAAAFVALNVQRKPLNRMELFRAALVAEDEAATQVMRAITDARLTLAKHSNPENWKPGELYQIGGLINFHRRHGEDLTRVAVDVLAEAFRGEVLRYAGTLLGGIAGAVAAESAPGRPAFSADLLIGVLRGQSQAEWNRDIALARAEDTGKQWNLIATAVIGAAYREAADE